MDTTQAQAVDHHPIYVQEPDVWWGDDGIDAMLWADLRPYEEPLLDAPVEASVPSIADDLL